VPGSAVFGTLKMPVVVSKLEPAVGAAVCVKVTLLVVAGLAPVVSLLKTFSVVAVPNGVTVLSLSASMMLMLALLALLALLVSFTALVVPATVTAVAVVSVPPAVPGMTTVSGQVRVAPAGKLAAVPLLATQAPTVTVAPTVGVLAVQVAVFAVAPAAALVQIKLPVKVAPGAAVAGKPVIALVMSGRRGLVTKQLAGAVQVGPPVGTTLLLTLVVAAAVTLAV
jgi:hypothetical protein